MLKSLQLQNMAQFHRDFLLAMLCTEFLRTLCFEMRGWRNQQVFEVLSILPEFVLIAQCEEAVLLPDSFYICNVLEKVCARKLDNINPSHI